MSAAIPESARQITSKGFNSDAWLEDAARQKAKEKIKLRSVMRILGQKEWSLSTGWMGEG
jgi:hypothetical protein